MTKKALVVEDDPQVMDYIEDTLCSLDHEHVWVTNQHDARQRFRGDQFDYVLLDLQIPAKPNRGGASKEFGMNLLRELVSESQRDLPVIIMTAYHAAGLNLTSKLTKLGASEFIAKPFEGNERSLAKVILKVLGGTGKPVKQTTRSAEPPEQTFAGGELVLYPTHAELLGVKIITERGRGLSLSILNLLAQLDSQGRYVRMSADELAIATKSMGGVNSITAAIQTLRRNATQRLAKIGVTCEADDFIGHEAGGYHLHESVQVRLGERPRAWVSSVS